MRFWTLVVGLATLSHVGTYGAPASGTSNNLPPAPGGEVVQQITQEVTSPHAEEGISTPQFLPRRQRSEPMMNLEVFHGCEANETISTVPCQTEPVECSNLDLLRAAIQGDVAAVKRTLPAGVNATVCGLTPLSMAIIGDQLDIVRVLLSSGDNATALTRAVDEHGRTPLHVAARTSGLDIARLLVAAGANVSAADKFGETPLHQASRRTNRAFVRFLLENGADVNATSNNDSRSGHFSPLLLAAAEGHEGMVEELLSAGADVQAKNFRGSTALIFAVYAQSTATVRVLLAHGVDVHARLANGWTALHIAAKISAPSGLVKALMEAGADAAATDNAGRTPLDDARTDDVRRALERRRQR